MKLEKSVPFHVKMEQLQKVGGGGGGGPGTPQPPPPALQPPPPPQPPPQPPALPKMPAGFTPYPSAMHNNIMRSTYLTFTAGRPVCPGEYCRCPLLSLLSRSYYVVPPDVIVGCPHEKKNVWPDKLAGKC